MTRHVYKIGDNAPGFIGIKLGNTPPAGLSDPCAATLSQFDDFDASCKGEMDLSVNVSTNTTEVPGVYCDPAPEVQQSAPTEEWSANASLLMDEDLAQGVAAFLMEHSTEVAWLIIGEHAAKPGDPSVAGAPQFVAKVRLVSPTLMGEPGVVRQVSVTFPVDGKPYACFGRAGSTHSVGTIPDANDVSAQHAAAAAMDDLTKLKADQALGDANYTGPAFAPDTYITLGDGSKAHYASNAWSAGPMASS